MSQEQGELTRELSQGLAGYLHAVAGAVGVPAEGTTFEISDTATAYLALASHRPEHPERDLMLLWSERTGWTVSVETDPDESPMVVARMDGADPVPAPDAVASFVKEALTAPDEGARAADRPVALTRARLAERLTRYAARL